MTGYEGLSGGAAWIELSTRGKIRVSGDDRARLLHAMSTNHVQDLKPGDGQYAFFLTALGRILADAHIYNFGDSFLLDTEPEAGEKLREHLDKYIIADDVTLEDETNEWAAVGLEGPQFREQAQALGILVPEQRFSVAEWGSGFVGRVAASARDGIRVFVPAGEHHELIQRLTDFGIPNATPEEARLVRLENGIPRYGEDISERYLVQETQQTHAVHTNKGCYLGQEIVERVRSRGQVHRVLTPIRIKGDQVPPPGTKLTVNGSNTAEITSAAYSPALGEVVALAYVRTEAARSKPEMIVAGSEPRTVAYIC